VWGDSWHWLAGCPLFIVDKHTRMCNNTINTINTGNYMNNQKLDERIKKQLERICYLKDGKVLISNNLPTPVLINRIQLAAWWKQEYKILNGLPIKDIRQYFQ